VIRCLLLPAVLNLIGRATWEIPGWLDRLLPRLNIEGSPPPAATPGQDGRSSVGPPATTGQQRPDVAAGGAEG
jgi:RND superfamily putative drug exporter